MSNKSNCPNCGAPIKHYYNYNCEYCGTFLHNTDTDLKLYKNKDIQVTNVEVEFDYLTHSFIVYIQGITISKGDYLVESGNDMVTIPDLFKDNRINYAFRIPVEYINRAGNLEQTTNFLINYIKRSLPDEYKYYKHEIIDKVLKYVGVII